MLSYLESKVVDSVMSYVFLVYLLLSQVVLVLDSFSI